MPEPQEEEIKPEEVDQNSPGNDGPPEGIKGIFISGPTQQIFQCVADSDVTGENPFKLISKQAILDDLHNRAAVCDFHPVRKQVEVYEGEEILLVYDYEFKYGENYYVCLTEEAKDWVLHPPSKEGGEGTGEGEEMEEAVEIPKTPEAREWICLGSDLEILEAKVVNTRELMKFTFAKKRRLFNSACKFEDRDAIDQPEKTTYIPSVEDDNFELQKMELECGSQAVPPLVDVAIQTAFVKPHNKAIQYVPRSLSNKESQEQLESKGFKEFTSIASRRFELALQQNEIGNFFIDDYDTLPDTYGIMGDKTDNSIKEYQSYTDLTFSKNKCITWIDWHPSIRGIVAVSCGENYRFNERVDLSSKLLTSHHLILIWSFADPIRPVLFLEAPEDVKCFHFNPYKPNFVIAGCLNGQIVLWDISEYEDRLQFNKPLVSETKGNAATDIFDTDPKLKHAPIVQCCVLSNIDGSHKRAISDIQWLPPHMEIDTKTGDLVMKDITAEYQPECLQVVTASIDGSVMFWDMRPPPPKPGTKKLPDPSLPSHLQLNLTWKPFIKVNLPRSEHPGDFAATRVSVREQLKLPLYREPSPQTLRKKRLSVAESQENKGNTTFYVGTEDGEVVFATWSFVRDAESGRMMAQRPRFSFNYHCGPVTYMERSPFFSDIILSIGGWSFAIWKEGSDVDAIMKSKSFPIQLTGGAWSPTRPGVFYVIKANGNIDVWDLMEKTHEPSHSQNISSVSLTSITPVAFSYKHHLMAVGDQIGTLHVLEVPWPMRHPSSNEYSVIDALFDRNHKQMMFASERMERRMKEKQEMDAAMVAKQQENKESAVAEQESWEDEAKKEYVEYLALENKLLIELGIRDQAPEEED